MSSSVSSLADNLSERLHKDKCKNCKSDLEYLTAKDKALPFKCVGCNRNYESMFDEDVANRLQNTHQFCDGDLSKSCRMLWKGVYRYEYIDSW